MEYTKPEVDKYEVKIETGFQASVDWSIGSPGGEIDVNDYDGEL